MSCRPQVRTELSLEHYHHHQFDSASKMSQQELDESHGAAPEIALLVAQSLTAVGKHEDSLRCFAII
jgi:hypothetical protein